VVGGGQWAGFRPLPEQCDQHQQRGAGCCSPMASSGLSAEPANTWQHHLRCCSKLPSGSARLLDTPKPTLHSAPYHQPSPMHTPMHTRNLQITYQG
jgi:hypothetical protein